MSIFLSYSSKDVDYAQKMVDAIRANGEDVWFAVDSIRIGENYAESIVRAIEKSDKVLMLLSKNSAESKHVIKELNLALHYEIEIYPIRLENIILDATMQYYFISSQWEDLFYEDFDSSLTNFVNKTFPKTDILVRTDEVIVSPDIQISKAKIDPIGSSFNIEEFTPEEYGVKSSFETHEEFLKRNLSYGYVSISKFDLKSDNYNIDTKVFTLIVDETIPSNTISIEPAIAQQLYKDTNNRKIYQKFSVDKEILIKSYFIIFKENKYELIAQEEKEKVEKKDFQVLFKWADKFNISESRFPREISALVNLTKLDLSDNQITEIPSEIGTLINLTKLDLSKNQIAKIPSEIAALISLTELDLWDNQITEIPSEIFALVNLTKLDLSKNQIVKIPREIAALVNLTELDLWDNQITEIPREISVLANLTVLALSKNQIVKIPREIAALVNLTELDLWDNQIMGIPKEIGALVNLTELYLSDNQIMEIPKEIGALVNLTELDLSDNQIEKIPREISTFVHLTKLDLSHNPIIEIPRMIVTLVNLIELNLSHTPIMDDIEKVKITF